MANGDNVNDVIISERSVKNKCSTRGCSIFRTCPAILNILSQLQTCIWLCIGGVVAWWSVRSFPERAIQVWALTGNIVLCSCARHLTLTVPLSIQEYKWVPTNSWGNLTSCGEVTCDALASRPRGVEILLASCYKNWDKHRQLWARWLQGFSFTLYDCVAQAKIKVY